MADVITKIGIKDATGTGFDSRDIGAKGQNIEIGYDNNDKIILDVDTTTPVSTKTLTSVLQTDDTLIANLNTSKAPNKHNWTASESVDYGKADATHFGHIRPGTGLYVDSDASSATYGSTNVSFASNKEVAANKAVQGNDSRLSDARKNPNAITFNSTGGAALGTTYDGSAARTIDYSTVGAAPISHTSIQGGESTLGHVKAGTGLSASSGVLSVKYGTASGTACAGNDSRLSDNRTPKSHASATAITYGAGTDEQYGHVMLSDTYSVETPSKDDSGAAVSLGASAYALQTAYNSLSSSVSSLNSNLSSLQTQCNSGTVNNANLWGNHSYDVGVENTTDTWILVESNSKVQHTLPSTIMNLAYNSYYNGSILTRASDVTMTEFTLTKYGKMCQLFYVGVVKAAATNYSYEVKNCGTLASGYRPARNVRVVAKLQASSYSYIVEIQMNGSMFIWNWGSEKGIPASSVVFCATYFTA